MRVKTVAVSAVVLAMLGVLGVVAQTQEAVFTKDQAANGQTLYQAHCAACHGAKLEGAGAPALDAATLYIDWGTADTLYLMLSKSMPPQNPGTLKEDEYVSILAYILKANGFPEGTKPLTSKLDELKKIKFPKPKS